jgi:PadR family transcriptional regulator, regulatory protein AphA
LTNIYQSDILHYDTIINGIEQMAQINKTQYAILGMLSIRPRSGYDIKKQINRSIGFFWNENFGHIYPILKRMEKDGFVTKRVEETGCRPRKNVFTLTEKGNKELKRWLAIPVSEQPVRNELLLKIFFGAHLKEGDIMAMIEVEKEKSVKLAKLFNSIAQESPADRPHDLPYWLMTMNFGKKKAEMTIEWCDETLKAIKKMKGKKTRPKS